MVFEMWVALNCHVAMNRTRRHQGLGSPSFVVSYQLLSDFRVPEDCIYFWFHTSLELGYQFSRADACKHYIVRAGFFQILKDFQIQFFLLYPSSSKGQTPFHLPSL